MKKIAFITGATSGIGEAIARILAPDHSLIICGRRKEKLAKLASELRAKSKVHTLSFDVSDATAVQSAIDGLPTEWQDIEVLVNNAGNAHGRSPIHEGELADWDAMIDGNLKGLLYVTRVISPRMVAKKSGDIINIGSIAGKEVYPEGNVYCASKFGVDAATKGMRLDLNPYGIRVIGIHPGLVETEFSMVRFKGDKQKSKSVYEGITPLYGKDIAEMVKFVIDRPPHVTIADITIFPTAQASSTLVHRQP
ncbi:SDR family NAD(P)-dependent oxidoreductase [Reichenbachiella carrageenanivorans]|uniref:SDR family NAD(P)-dependent oxidoreductase n=1 Tax=Reichenbachiella carrageenanivorans TaxID=2979869 RepID=A0ABY6D5Q3_9BACT|nr:SDR family NAD(P)-dependent oxidoreductase [Reichenbachiella carrageenanivorans]UXX80925.1 SDR family NAD(P)-dependent oxidoreductase [Reichenbachiella carrageenanivorans]